MFRKVIFTYLKHFIQVAFFELLKKSSVVCKTLLTWTIFKQKNKLSQYKSSIVCETCTEVSKAVAKVLSEKSTKVSELFLVLETKYNKFYRKPDIFS